MHAIRFVLQLLVASVDMVFRQFLSWKSYFVGICNQYPHNGRRAGSVLNINQVRYFISAVERGSFSAAAADHYITAQGMSKAIADLEHEIGLQLLVRKNRGVEPTEFGAKFYEQAKLAERCFDNLEGFARDYVLPADGAPSLVLLICAPSFIGMGKVSTSVAAFIRKNLGINASISFGLPDYCLTALSDGTADLVITIGKASIENIDCDPIGTIPCGAQVSLDNPLSRKKNIRLVDLEGAHVAFWPGNEFFNESIKKRLAEKGAMIDPIPLEADLEDMTNLLERGGALFLPYISAIEDEVVHSIAVPFDPSEGITAPLCLLGNPKNQSSKMQALKRFFMAAQRFISESKASEILSQ